MARGEAASPHAAAGVETAAGSCEEQTLLILGASGDLTARLLLPGLGGLLATGSVENLQLVGSAVDDWDDARWRKRIGESFALAGAGGKALDAVASSARYLRSDVTDEDDWRGLLGACRGAPILYFALPPAITEKACHALTGLQLPEGTRLVMEKPFGSDAESAAALNDLVTRLVPEDRVHRVDHFVAMPPSSTSWDCGLPTGSSSLCSRASTWRAYGEVLKGILEGDPPLSVRGDMAVQCWRIIEPVRKAWRENQVPLTEYEAGSTDPCGWPPTGLPAGRE